MRNERHKSYIHNIPAARQLRRPLTPTELLFWEAVRDRRFLDLKFRRQHAVGRFVLDFYCHEHRLAIEIDGDVHLDPDQQSKDMERQSLLEEQGIRFIRISAADVASDIQAVLDRITQSLSPSPAKSGEGAGG